MSVTVMLEADVIPTNKKMLLDLLVGHLPETRKYKGFISISVLSECDSDQIVLLSKWEHAENYKDYLQWRVETGVMAELSEHLQSPPSIRYLTTEIA